MAHQITGIDHVSVAVADPVLVHRTFSRLGFFISPLLRNASAGTLTHCLAFEADHIALSAADGEKPESRRLRRLLGDRPGKLMGVGLGSRDIQASYESLRRAQVDLPPPNRQTRLLVGPDGTEDCPGWLAMLSEALTPGLSVDLCQDAAPDSLRRPEWRDHPNTARGIVSLSVLLDNPEAAVAGYNRLFGPAACTPTDDVITVHTGHGLIFLVTADGFDDLHPSLDVRLPSPPAMVVLTIGVADLAKAAAVLAANGVAAERRGAHLGISAEDALGIGLEFVEG